MTTSDPSDKRTDATQAPQQNGPASAEEPIPEFIKEELQKPGVFASRMFLLEEEE